MIFFPMLQAIVAARKFTDPKVSVKERMRALSGFSSEVPNVVQSVYRAMKYFCLASNF
jgi:hypothetical protein